MFVYDIHNTETLIQLASLSSVPCQNWLFPTGISLESGKSEEETELVY